MKAGATAREEDYISQISQSHDNFSDHPAEETWDDMVMLGWIMPRPGLLSYLNLYDLNFLSKMDSEDH